METAGIGVPAEVWDGIIFGPAEVEIAALNLASVFLTRFVD